MSRRFRTSRTRRFDGAPPVRALGRGLVVAVLIAGLAWLAATFYNGVPGRNYEFVDAKVPRVGSLLRHDPVRLGGVRVGQVRSIDLASDGQTQLRLQFEPNTRVPRDSKILIRANGLLGARFVEIVPGASARQIRPGEVIQGDDSALTAGATDALDTFDRETRGALRPLLGELGTGFAGQGRNVNDLVRVGAREIGPTTKLFTTLNAHGDALRALFPSLNAGLAPLNDSRDALTGLIAAGDRALRPFLTEREAFDDTLGVAPSTLAAADAGLSAGRPLLQAARALSAQARRTLPAAPAGLRAAAALLREARSPLVRSDALLRRVPDTVPAALKALRAGRPIADPLAKMLDDLVTVADRLAPYGCDLENFGAVFRSMTGLGTQAGGEQGGGPNGPAMQFRLQAAATPTTEALSLVDTTGMVRREGYSKPCKYPAKPYPIIQRPVALSGGGR
jgi:virulence factor Mce-like protein